MNKFFTLLKISLHGVLNFKNNIKDSKKKKQSLLLVFGYGIIAFYIYLYAKISIEAYVTLNIPYILLATHMVMASVMTIYFTLFKINGMVFNTKDSDLLHSLPIKKSTILLKNVANLYLVTLATCALLVIPAFIVYVSNVAVTPIFVILFFLTFLIIPFFPIVVASIVGTLMAIISSRFKRKNLISIILSLALVGVIYYYSMTMDMSDSMDLANLGKSMVNMYNKFYPLTTNYINIINDSSIKDLLIYLSIPSVLMALYIFLLSKFQTKLESKMKAVHKSKVKEIKYSARNVTFGLIKKESRKYFTSTIYFLNTFIGIILMTAIGVIGCVAGMDKIREFLQDDMLSNAVLTLSPLLLALFVGMSCTTNSSISLEGKSFGILKSLPVDPRKIISSKIYFFMILIIPAVLINTVLFTIMLKLPLYSIILTILIPIAFGLLVGQIGVYANLCFPNLNYDNEVKVVKQSTPVFLTLFGSMVLLIGCIIGINYIKFMSINVSLTIFLGLIIICILIMKMVLDKSGVKKLKELF